MAAKKSAPKTLKVKKVTLKAIYEASEVRKIDELKQLEKGQEAPVAIVYGEAIRANTKQTNFGPSFQFIGKFRGQDQDGVQLEGSSCYLPEFIANELAAGIAEHGSVRFGYTITAVGRPDLAINYEYLAESLLDQSNPFEALEAEIQQSAGLITSEV